MLRDVWKQISSETRKSIFGVFDSMNRIKLAYLRSTGDCDYLTQHANSAIDCVEEMQIALCSFVQSCIKFDASKAEAKNVFRLYRKFFYHIEMLAKREEGLSIAIQLAAKPLLSQASSIMNLIEPASIKHAQRGEFNLARVNIAAVVERFQDEFCEGFIFDTRSLVHLSAIAENLDHDETIERNSSRAPS